MIRKLAVVIGIMSVATVTFAQPQPDTIDSLARGWSGGRSTSLCKPDGVDENAATLSRCEWLLPQGQRVQGEVQTTRYIADTAMVVWQRQLTNISDMNRVVDSLGIEFKLRGMTMRPCRPGTSPAGSDDSRIWEDKKLLVHISAITPPAGRPKIIVVGTNVPSAYPEAICPKRRDGGL
ncbi:MAG: hypothetical protein ABJB74_08830 [Gemmatimonas sp.]